MVKEKKTKLEEAPKVVELIDHSNDLDGVMKEHDGPKLKGNVLSRLTFWPATPLVRAGAKKPIEKKQLFRLEKPNRTTTVWKRFKKNWKLEENEKEISVFRAVRRTFLVEWLSCILLQTTFAAFQFTSPVLLPYLLDYLNDPTIPDWHGYLYVIAIFLSAVIGALFFYHSNLRAFSLGIKIRAALTQLIYYKALRVSSSQSSSSGQITNLVTSDAQIIQDTLVFFNQGFIAPVQIIVCTGLIWAQLGPFALISIGLLVVVFPLNIWFARLTSKYRFLQQKATDVRVKFMREVINAIRIVKYYAWERPFKANIMAARKAEMSKVTASLRIRAFMFTVLTNVPTLSVGLTFFFLGIQRGPSGFTVKEVFTALSLLNLLRGPFIFFPIMFANTLQYKVSFERIHSFVSREELPKRDRAKASTTQKVMIRMKNASFKWPTDTETPHLNSLNLKVKRGECCAIVGSVGSGKSTLCQAVLGEIRQVAGTCDVYGSFAYAAQDAWIINASVRDNIVFGRPFDMKRYRRVVKASALVTDLAQFPAGDLTEIGEKGVNLSGGQKQRVSIARALYSDKDLIVLDDIFSAVDAHVGRHLWEKAVKGFLMSEGKTVLLVTNQLQYVPGADHIVMLKNGSIIEQGTFKDLMNAKADFSDMIREYGVFDDDKDGEEEDAAIKKPASPNHAGDSDSSELGIVDISKGTSKQAEAFKAAKGALTFAENKESGNIGLSVYWGYAKAGGAFLFVCNLILYCVRIASRVNNAIFLSTWASLGPMAYQVQPQIVWQSVWLAEVFVEILAVLSNSLILAYWAANASRYLHNRMFSRVLRAPIAFFDSTPIGRLLARFSKDMNLCDTLLPQQWDQMFNMMFNLLGIFAQLAAGNQYILLVIVPVMIIYFFLQRFYRKTSIEIQRQEALSRAPILSHLSTSLEGAATIRSYDMEKQFKTAIMNKIDLNTVDFYGLRYCAMWFGLRLDWCGNAIILATYLAIALTRNYGTIDPALAGLAMSATSSITFLLSGFSQNFAELETRMNSAERLQEWAHLDQEAPDIIDENRPAEKWPRKGKIQFDKISISYNGTDKVLKQISASIKPGERVGIVGRTGAGKSTLITALFRLTEFFEGTIKIDGVDVNNIGLFDLRSKLSIIPQSPTLFIGTIRYNVDPFVEHTDEQIWNALELIQLKPYVESLPGKLDFKVVEGGGNMSQGQRQLLSMSRALLRGARVLLLDEATSSVDTETDALIQKMIRTVFKEQTLLCIAHRLNTIMDSDRVMVLDKGELVEFDTPKNLLDNSNSIFSSMVAATGPATEAYLRQVAYGERSVLETLALSPPPPEGKSGNKERIKM